MNKITACITLLATEAWIYRPPVAPPEEAAKTYKFNPPLGHAAWTSCALRRINSSSFDPSLRRNKVSKRSTSSTSSAEAVKEEPEAVEETNEEPANQPQAQDMQEDS